MNDTTGSAPLTKGMLDEVLAQVYAQPNPYLMLIDPQTHEMFSLIASMEGRNWRKVKREIRKLDKLHRRERRLNPIKISPFQNLWWRNQSLTETPISET